MKGLRVEGLPPPLLIASLVSFGSSVFFLLSFGSFSPPSTSKADNPWKELLEEARGTLPRARACACEDDERPRFAPALGVIAESAEIDRSAPRLTRPLPPKDTRRPAAAAAAATRGGRAGLTALAVRARSRPRPLAVMRATGASVLQGGDAEAALLESSTLKRTRLRKRRSESFFLTFCNRCFMTRTFCSRAFCQKPKPYPLFYFPSVVSTEWRELNPKPPPRAKPH